MEFKIFDDRPSLGKAAADQVASSLPPRSKLTTRSWHSFLRGSVRRDRG
jgi:hypothetical protein